MLFAVASPQRLLGLLSVLLSLASVLGAPYGNEIILSGYDSGYDTDGQAFVPSPPRFHLEPASDLPPFASTIATNALQELHNAIETMQSKYFSLWLGKWTTAIDWTAAVMGTHVTGALDSLSNSVAYTMPGTFDKDRKLDVEAQMAENEINRYFSHSVAYYFGEEAFSLRQQAYDDMLWVVLGWLDSIRFAEDHTKRHYPSSSPGSHGEPDWHGRQFAPAFAHRARIFYELAEMGWDTRLCGGGMVWNPRLAPYKNAITNELFISASVAMYLNFPGDENCSPYMSAKDSGKRPDWNKLRQQELGDQRACNYQSHHSSYDLMYLNNAIKGYNWLKKSGMKNDKGLYTDGFHIKDLGRLSIDKECNERNEMVYTYNQGVILSGLRGLWEAAGNMAFLEEGHELIRSVIRATGWSDSQIRPTASMTEPGPESSQSQFKPQNDGSWAGLGANGILMDACDPSGTCNQDGQTFKGIFFHHLTAFCAPLPTTPATPGKTHAASRQLAALHRASCDEYAPWVIKNGQAALRTRNGDGLFGNWWGAGDARASNMTLYSKLDRESLLDAGAVDYRNDEAAMSSNPPLSGSLDPSPAPETQRYARLEQTQVHKSSQEQRSDDLNDRGRGRTIETQGSGVAVTRAMWEFIRNYEGGLKGGDAVST